MAAEEQINRLGERMRKARAVHEQRVAAIEAGTAPDAWRAAVAAASTALDGEVAEDERQFIVSSVADATSSRRAETFDPHAIGEKIARDVRKVRDLRRGGGVFAGLRGTRPTLGLVRANIEADRHQPVPNPLAPLIVQGRAAEEHAERQTAILEGLLAVATQQAKTQPIIVLGAAAIVAAVVAVIALLTA